MICSCLDDVLNRSNAFDISRFYDFSTKNCVFWIYQLSFCGGLKHLSSVRQNFSPQSTLEFKFAQGLMMKRFKSFPFFFFYHFERYSFERDSLRESRAKIIYFSLPTQFRSFLRFTKTRVIFEKYPKKFLSKTLQSANLVAFCEAFQTQSPCTERNKPKIIRKMY